MRLVEPVDAAAAQANGVRCCCCSQGLTGIEPDTHEQAHGHTIDKNCCLFEWRKLKMLTFPNEVNLCRLDD